MKAAGPGRTVYVAIATLVVVLDQVTKVLVDRFMSLHESRIIVDGFLRLTYVRNRGAAFGILSDADLPYQPLLFAVVSLAALGAIAAYAWRLPARSRLPQTALALIMGGALGNLMDRARLGHVIDFALVPAATNTRLDAQVPRGAPCGAAIDCDLLEERFADTFAKWALNGAVSAVGAGYGIPAPASIEDWGAPLAELSFRLPT